MLETSACTPYCAGQEDVALSGQEKRILGIGEDVFTRHDHILAKIVQTFDGLILSTLNGPCTSPEALKETEGQPSNLRWAKALYNIASNITIYIDDYQLLAGRIGCKGRYGILYPEIEGDFYETFLDKLGEREGGAAFISPETMNVIKEEIGPYWKGKTYHENFNAAVPKELHDILFIDKEGTTPRYLVERNGLLAFLASVGA